MRKTLRHMREFVDPKLKAGRVPLGRTAIVIQIVGALIFLGYTLVKKDIRLPFSAEPYEVQVLFPDAKGLDPEDGPDAAVAGSPVGKVTAVEFVDGRALATLELDAEVEGKIFADATAAVRPASALQNLLVNVDPGSPDAGPLPADEPIQPQNTKAFVSIDELTSVFDADTQAYAQILITEAERALQGRDGELRAALGELGELTDGATPVAAALADRRRLLTELVGSLDTVLNTLARRGDQLRTVVDAGSRTLAVTAARSGELEAATRNLAPFVRETRRSLAATRELTRPLAPALERLAPAARFLPEGAVQLRRLLPPADMFLSQIDTLTTEGRLPIDLLLTGSEGLATKVQNLIPVAQDLAFRTELMDRYKVGAAQFADTWSSAFSVQDQAGPYGQTDVLKIEPLRPENFGFPPNSPATRSVGGEPSRLEALLAKVLERTCTEGTRRSPPNPFACLLRFQIPELPDQPLTARTDPEPARGG